MSGAPRGLGAAFRRSAETPPIWFGAALGAGLLVAIVGGGGFMLTLAQELQDYGAIGSDGVIRIACVGALVGVLTFSLLGLGPLDARLKRRWKREVAARLGLAHLPLERFVFVLVLRAPYAGGSRETDVDAGLLAETESALVFFGREGRVVTAFADIHSTGAVGFRGNWWLRFELGDGSILCVSVQEGPTTWGKCPGTAALAHRMQARCARRYPT